MPAAPRIVWDVFADFPCNAGGVRIAVRKTNRGAERTASQFAKRNRLPMSAMSWRSRLDTLGPNLSRTLMTTSQL